MLIRQLTQDDLNDLLLMGNEEPEFRIGSGVFWTESQLKRWIDSPDDLCLGAFLDGRLAGFVLAAVHVPTGKATIENIHVDPRWRKKGIAGDLLEDACLRLHGMGVIGTAAFVREGNEPSQALFRSSMFVDGGLFHWQGRIHAANRRERR